MRLSAGNPMGRVLSILLVFEAVVFGLAVPGMIMIDAVQPLTAGLAAGGAGVLALLSAGTLRRGVGYPLGWLTQVAGLALGLLTSWMFVMGGLFAVLWVTTMVLGKRLDAAS